MKEIPRTIKEQQAEGDGKRHDNPRHAGITSDQKAREAADQKIKEWKEAELTDEERESGNFLGC